MQNRNEAKDTLQHASGLIWAFFFKEEVKRNQTTPLLLLVVFTKLLFISDQISGFLGRNLLQPPYHKIFILSLRAHHQVSACLVEKTFIYLLMCSLLNMVSILMPFTGVEISVS